MPKALSQAYRAIHETSETVHQAMVGLVATMVRPADKRSNAFTDHLAGLGQFSLLVARPQWRAYKGRPVTSLIVAVHTFTFHRPTGRVVVDAAAFPEGNPATWDVMVQPRIVRRPRAGGPPAYVLDPDRNKSGAASVLALYEGLREVVLYGGTPQPVPAFPEFRLLFTVRRPPTMERTRNLLAHVRREHPQFAAAPDSAIPDDLCRAVFETALARRGHKIWVPQPLLAREPGESWAAHPRDGSPPPATSAAEGACSGAWVMHDGAWVPAAQEPLDVRADLSGLLGRRSTAAWQLLVDAGYFTPMPYAEWLASGDDESYEALWQAELAGLFPPDGPSEMAAAWRARTGLVTVPDAAVAATFRMARRPQVWPELGRVDVIALQGWPERGHPHPEMLRFGGPGLEADLYTVRPEMAERAEPLSPRAAEHLRQRAAAARTETQGVR